MGSRNASIAVLAAVLAVSAAVGCRDGGPGPLRSRARAGAPAETPHFTPPANGGLLGLFRTVSLPAGATVRVRLGTDLSSADSREGDAWDGVVVFPVLVNDQVLLPAGSLVRGVVAVALPARDGRPARLQLALRSVVTEAGELAVDAVGRPVQVGTGMDDDAAAARAPGGEVRLPEGTLMRFTTVAETVIR